MTAEDFLIDKFNYSFSSRKMFTYDELISFGKDFAKMHVKLALKEALESIPCLGSSTDIATYEEVEEAVLNSYNLENIK